jgi:ATP-binding cassette, subfamily B, bacterial
MQIRTTQTTVGTKETFTFIWNIAKHFPIGIGIMLFVCVYWAIDMSIRPYILKVLLDRASAGTDGHDWLYLGMPIILWLCMYFVLSTVFRMYGYFVEIKMIPQMRKQIVAIAMNNLLVQSHSFYQNNFAGSIANKVKDLISSIPEIIQVVNDRLLSTFILIVIAIFMLWNVNIKFGIIMLTWALTFFSLTALLSSRLALLADDFSEKGSIVIGRIVDSLSNIMLIKLFARKKIELKYVDAAAEEASKAESKLWWMYFGIWCFNGYSFVLIMGLNFYYLVQGYNAGTITVGDFVLVVTISINIVDQLWELTSNVSLFSKYLGRITQGLRDILVVPDIQDKPGAKKLIITNGGTIKFDHVEFHYKNTHALFKDKSIVIPAGQKVGLVGYSGSGKSTFVNLILRMYDVDGGEILIDDQSISQVTQDSLHENIAMIPQDPTLFHRTLMENIRYGKINATDEDVIEAAKKAHAHEFILQLPLGYESLVGERGVKLSGGQRQRIAIARAILKNAPILILDEATSQLDSVTEEEIQHSLEHIMKDKTTLVIAHRLSTLLHMDRIIVFDRGKIMEDGTHKSLLKHNGLYKTLWDAQVGGFLPEKRV